MPILTLNSDAAAPQAQRYFILVNFLHTIRFLRDLTLHLSQTPDEQTAILKLDVSTELVDGAIVNYATQLAAITLAVEPQARSWLEKAQITSRTPLATFDAICDDLDKYMTLRTCINGHEISIIDILVWTAMTSYDPHFARRSQARQNVLRWYTFLQSSPASGIASATAQLRDARRQQASTIPSISDMSNIGQAGPLVTRFPPEPSGYLHIGHAKAALLNEYFARRAAGGVLICRFDDTNPSKETSEFQASILDDLAAIGIVPDQVSHSSDYFQQLYELAIKLIKDGKAFADDSELGKGNIDRRNRLPSSRRDLSVEDTLSRFEDMKTGSIEGQRWCLRAKIDFTNSNGTLRDPVIYRCNLTPHHRTGTAWNMYPTYDFCAPILDALEGVTLALRTNEYRDRNEQYAWFQDALGLRKVEIWDFSRMNFVRTVLSKRKLKQIVALEKVTGWDDPRMPTVRGMLRRGLTVDALREFILSQGPSRNILNLEWGALWAMNRKTIEPVAPRHVAIDVPDAVVCTVMGVSEASSVQWPKHAKNAALGTRTIVHDSTIMIEQADAASLEPDEEVTLMHWGNAIVRNVERKDGKFLDLVFELHLDGDVKTTKKKLTWLAQQPANMVRVQLVSFDYLITKDKLEPADNLEDFLTPVTEFRVDAWADCNVASLAQGDVIQFERKGFYRLDSRTDECMTFFEIPTGKKDGGR